MGYSTLVTELMSPPETIDNKRILSLTTFLCVLLVIAVPSIAITTSLPLLGLVAAAGICYLGILVVTDSIFEGACSAIFVLITFAANVPLHRISLNNGQIGFVLDIMLVDVVLLPLLALFAVWSIRDTTHFDGYFISKFRSGRIAGYALAGIVVWSLLSAIVSNGPSRLAAMFFVVVQLRYLLLFVVATQVVRYLGVYTSIYSILIAVSFQLLFALVQAINGVWFGLSYLGEASGGRHGYFFVGPVKLVEAIYPGGFAGTSRVLVAVLVLLVPILVEVIVHRRILWKFCAFVCILGSAVITRVSQTDAGLGAFSLVTLLSAIALTYFIITDRYQSSPIDNSEAISGIFSSVGGAVVTMVLFMSRAVNVPDTNSGNPSGGGVSDSIGSPSGGEPTHISPAILSALDSLPLISTKTLSIRIHQYVLAIDLGLRYPLFGIGGFNFAFLAMTLGLPKSLAIHNVYLSFVAEIGIPGALLLITAQVAVLYCVVRNIQTSEKKTLWAMVTCGLIGFCAYNFWVAIQSGVAYMTFWTFAGVVVGARR